MISGFISAIALPSVEKRDNGSPRVAARISAENRLKPGAGISGARFYYAINQSSPCLSGTCALLLILGVNGAIH